MMVIRQVRSRLVQWIRLALIAIVISLPANTGAADDSLGSTLFYATAEGGRKLIAIEGRHRHRITTRLIGPTGAIGCLALAIGPDRTAYSMCRTVPGGPQHLSTIDLETGKATIFGAPISGLDIMGLEFAPDGVLYTVGTTDRASPDYNSLYVVDTISGVPLRIGPTGAPHFLMDFAFDRDGTMFAVSSLALFRIDRVTGAAVQVDEFIGGGAIMGLGFDRHGQRLYVTDFKSPISDFYALDVEGGFLTPLARTGFANSHSLTAVDR